MKKISPFNWGVFLAAHLLYAAPALATGGTGAQPNMQAGANNAATALQGRITANTADMAANQKTIDGNNKQIDELSGESEANADAIQRLKDDNAELTGKNKLLQDQIGKDTQALNSAKQLSKAVTDTEPTSKGESQADSGKPNGGGGQPSGGEKKETPPFIPPSPSQGGGSSGSQDSPASSASSAASVQSVASSASSVASSVASADTADSSGYQSAIAAEIQGMSGSNSSANDALQAQLVNISSQASDYMAFVSKSASAAAEALAKNASSSSGAADTLKTVAAQSGGPATNGDLITAFAGGGGSGLGAGTVPSPTTVTDSSGLGSSRQIASTGISGKNSPLNPGSGLPSVDTSSPNPSGSSGTGSAVLNARSSLLASASTGRGTTKVPVSPELSRALISQAPIVGGSTRGLRSRARR